MTRKNQSSNVFFPSANVKRARYHRENPFIFFEEKDIQGFWKEISEFFGVDPKFPADQMMTRIASDSGRNVYFVSEALKQIVTSNQDKIKFINMGVRLLVRTDLRNDKDKRSLRLAQEVNRISLISFTRFSNCSFVLFFSSLGHRHHE